MTKHRDDNEVCRGSLTTVSTANLWIAALITKSTVSQLFAELSVSHRCIQSLVLEDAPNPDHVLEMMRFLTSERLDLGLRQREVAASMGVKKTTFGPWELENRIPSFDSLCGWARALGYEVVLNGAPVKSVKTLIALFRQERVSRNIDQDTIAVHIGRAVQTVSKWECARGVPGTETIDAWAAALGFRLDLNKVS